MAKKDEQKNNGSYTAKDIFVLKGLEPVRKRPGMYIGSTGPDGLHHLIWEVFDNSLDEAMGGYCTNIDIVLMKDNRVMISDNGRGIPVEKHPDTGKSTLETVMTTLHAGGKFGGDAYKVSGGLHGVGVSVVCALSKYMRAEVCREGVRWAQEYSQGNVKTKVEKAGVCKQTGTIIIFEPDKEIFKDNNCVFELKRILGHLRQQAYLTNGVKISVKDERCDPVFEYRFYFEGGLSSYVRYLVGDAETKHNNIFYCKGEKEGVSVEVALQYLKEFECLEESFANNIYTGEGGMHLTGFRTALTRSINDYARKNGLLREKDENLTGNDVREGLVAVVSVKIRETQFEGQTKAKLGNPEAKTAVEGVVGEMFADFLEKNPQDARAIVDNCLLSARARMAAKAARTTVLRKGVLDGLSLPGKLADCISKQPAESELYIVEGDSAGGCFVGDTKVALTDGRNLSFFDLIKEERAGKKNYCYTIKKDGSIGVGEIKNVRQTKQNAEVVRVMLDNGKAIVCTPDHKFLMRNGVYKQAREISTKDSLMPLYRKIAKKGGLITIDGYEMTFCPATHRWIFTHLLADRYNLKKEIYQKEQNSVVHHKDYNKLNNNPDNLCRMEKMEHLLFHATVARDNLLKPETLAKIKIAHQSEEYRKKVKAVMSTPEMRKMLSERAKKQWESDEYKKFMAKKFLDFYNSNEEYRKKNNKLLNNQQRIYWLSQSNRKNQSERVKKFFQENPEVRKSFSEFSKKQWQNKELLKWRRKKTKEQWTAEFRVKRKKAYNKVYLQHSLKLLKEILEREGRIIPEKYEQKRIATKNKNALKFENVCSRFFNNNVERLQETVANFNHKIKRIEKITEKFDVFDLEVEGTHNFALSSGVFVHNSSKMARNRKFQAILPLRGKILNVERARMDRILSSDEIKHLIIAMGTAIAQDFNLENLRYHRIIIMSDADVDGAHIRTLLLTLFFRHFKEVIEKGYLYIAQPPLYKIKAGKRLEYAYNDEEKEEIIDDILKEKGKLKESKKSTATKPSKEKAEKLEVSEEVEEGAETTEEEKISGVFVQRYKGLGEMNPEELWETTMNPENRVLLQVKVEDAKEADRMFDILMGQEVAPRKKFIQTHAKSVKNLDI
ncbi:MAG: ATP-binding protein [Candidatus Pacebacteria bacterium]|nr:ATP-binding protein [Candidatus Paceibacterota bacterium]